MTAKSAGGRRICTRRMASRWSYWPLVPTPRRPHIANEAVAVGALVKPADALCLFIRRVRLEFEFLGNPVGAGVVTQKDDVAIVGGSSHGSLLSGTRRGFR